MFGFGPRKNDEEKLDVAKEKMLEAEIDSLMTISGGISGAITDIETEEAYIHAIKRYMFFRSIDHDVSKIAKNTGIDEKKIRHIKEYLFFENAITDDNGEPAPFDPNFAIASSWDRLAFEPEKIQPHDLLLLNHELYEMSLYFQGYSQDIAHDIATQKYNYTDESTRFYQKLREKQKRKHKETPITLESLIKFKQIVKNAMKILKDKISDKSKHKGR